MLNAQDIYEIAKSYQAEITAGRQIQWHDMENSLGEWKKVAAFRPSVLDAVILDTACHMPNYLEAAKAATVWSDPMVMGCLQAMLLGRPLKTQGMYMENFRYWKGMVISLMVIQKLKSRLWEAESLFS